MKYLLAFTTLFLLIACSHTDHKKQLAEKPQGNKYKSLLAKYKDITFDTLKIFSTDDPDSKSYQYNGTKIDTLDVLLLPQSIAEQYVNVDGYFACFKFLIDSSRIGLVTRTPSTYASSSIKLLVLNKQKDSITAVIELAETFGDAGDMLEKISWIFKEDDGKIKSFIWDGFL